MTRPIFNPRISSEMISVQKEICIRFLLKRGSSMVNESYRAYGLNNDVYAG